MIANRVLVFRPLCAVIAVDIAVTFPRSTTVIIVPANHGHVLPLSAARRVRVPETRDSRRAVDHSDTLRRRDVIVAERHVTHARRTSGFVAVFVSVSVCRAPLLVLVTVFTVKVEERCDEKSR